MNCLVFPGSGHLMIKKRVRGGIVLVTATASVIILMDWIVGNAVSIIMELQESGVTVGPESVLELTAEVKRRLFGADSLKVKVALGLMVGSWIGAMADIGYLYYRGTVHTRNPKSS